MWDGNRWLFYYGGANHLFVFSRDGTSVSRGFNFYILETKTVALEQMQKKLGIASDEARGSTYE